MATKPSSSAFTFSTDTNFSTGPAAGQPTKVAPAGWPSNLQGFVPGLEYAAEFRNWLLNVLGDWTGWLDAGSAAGAADEHIVEADAAGHTKLRGIMGDLFRLVLTPNRLDVSSNVTAHNSDEMATLYLLDNTGAGGLTTVTIKADATHEDGELVILAFTTAGAAFDVAVASESGGSNPIWTLQNSPSVNPDWIIAVLDKSITGSNADGEWIVVAHGTV